MTQPPPPPPPTDPPPGSPPPPEGYPGGGYQAGGYPAGYGQQPGYEAGGYQAGGYQAGGYQAGGYQPGDPAAGYQGYGQQPGYPAAPPPKKRPGWLLPVIIGGIVLLLCCIGGVVTGIVLLANADSDSDPSPTTQAPTQPDPETTDGDEGDDEEPPADTAEGTFGSGTYEVGSDIAAGMYVTTVPDGGLDSCYFARLAGFSGDFEDIIANSNFASGARGRVEISSSDAGIEFSGTCEWVALSEAPPVDAGDEVGAGIWAVGEELEPGTYRTEAPDGDFLNSCYWARLSGFSADFDDIITNAIVDPGATGRVEISANDVGIEFSGACVWTRD